MDPFTQRMLERARARQEKIDQKLVSSGQTVPKRKPLTENIALTKKDATPTKSPGKPTRDSILSPKKTSRESLSSESPVRSPRRSGQKTDVVSAISKPRNDYVVTKKEFNTPTRGSSGRRNSDVSVEINIMHRNDIQIEVQVEERDAPIDVVYDRNGVIVKEIEDDTSKPLETDIDAADQKIERAGLRNNFKSRLDRLGNLYSDKPTLSSPIHRTEQDFNAATPPSELEPRKSRPKPDGKKFGRLAALADQINNWEDDLSHHTNNPEPAKETKKNHAKSAVKNSDASTLDISIHSINDINKALHNVKSNQPSKSTSPSKTNAFVRPRNECQRLDRKIVAELEPKRASTTPSAAAAPNMATMVASAHPAKPAITKKPSIKKYKAPTPPRIIDDDNCESDKDKENNLVRGNDNDATESCIQTKPEPAEHDPVPGGGSPLVKKFAPKLNGNVDRNSVLSRAAMFEAGSPKAKDPAEMSLRERKALFEKNKGAVIMPKAPFGQAPSVKTLHGDKDKKTKTTPKPTRRNSQEEDSTSITSVGGIKGKLAALFNKEQTISESTIANKFKQEREMEMEMLQNRFHYKPKPEPKRPNDSDDENSENDPSEDAPLMGSTTNLAQTAKKPEIISNIPKVSFDEAKKHEERREKVEERVVGAQPVKRRSSQDSPVVLSVLEDVKRIKVNNSKKEPQTNGTVTNQPASLYPHLSDLETDGSNTQDEYSDCGGSRCGYYALECVFLFLCI